MFIPPFMLILGLAFAFFVGSGLGIRLVRSLGRSSNSLVLPPNTRLFSRANGKRLIKGLIVLLPFGQRLLGMLRMGYRKGKFFWRSCDPAFSNASKSEQYLQLGHLLVQEELLDLALEQFSKAIDLAPCASQGYIQRGRALHQVGRLEEAFKDYRLALALRTRRLDETQLLHASLSILLVDLQDIEQALFHQYTYFLFQRCGKADSEQFQQKLIPPDAERFQIWIETHDHLAEHVINTQGDFDAALSVYRRKQQLQQCFAETFALTASRIAYLPDDWVRNIGHMALLDFWVKMKHLRWRSWEQLILLAPPHATANEAYLSYWKQHFTVISDPHLIQALTPFANALGNRVASLLKLPDDQEKYFCEGMGVIQEEWESQRRSPLLELTGVDREHGWKTLLRMGIPAGAWFVCLHVRSPGFHKEGEGQHQAHRNADIHTYLPAIRSIIARGGWVIRLGDDTMEPLLPLTGLVDYAHSSIKSSSMDIFLCAACRFFIGVASGLSHVPTTFGVPCVLTNWVSNAFPVYSDRDLFVPKLTWSDGEKRLLGFRESLNTNVRRLSYSGQKLQERNMRAVDNTPEEILELVEEMLEVVDGTAVYTAADERLQQEFREVAVRSGMVGFSRLGRAFLRKYAHLVGNETL